HGLECADELGQVLPHIHPRASAGRTGTLTPAVCHESGAGRTVTSDAPARQAASRSSTGVSPTTLATPHAGQSNSSSPGSNATGWSHTGQSTKHISKVLVVGRSAGPVSVTPRTLSPSCDSSHVTAPHF